MTLNSPPPRSSCPPSPITRAPRCVSQCIFTCMRFFLCVHACVYGVCVSVSVSVCMCTPVCVRLCVLMCSCILVYLQQSPGASTCARLPCLPLSRQAEYLLEEAQGACGMIKHKAAACPRRRHQASCVVLGAISTLTPTAICGGKAQKSALW